MMIATKLLLISAILLEAAEAVLYWDPMGYEQEFQYVDLISPEELEDRSSEDEGKKMFYQGLNIEESDMEKAKDDSTQYGGIKEWSPRNTRSSTYKNFGNFHLRYDDAKPSMPVASQPTMPISDHAMVPYYHQSNWHPGYAFFPAIRHALHFRTKRSAEPQRFYGRPGFGYHHRRHHHHHHRPHYRPSWPGYYNGFYPGYGFGITIGAGGRNPGGIGFYG